MRILSSLLLLLSFLSTTLAAPSSPEIPLEKAVPYELIPPSAYQNFLKNWDPQSPTLSALIQSPTQYNALYHPAPLNRPNRPFAPPPEFFEKSQILVVARVVQTPQPNAESLVLTVKSLSAIGSHLTLHYSFNPPPPASSQSKNVLALRLPIHHYDRVSFIENGTKVADLLPEKNWVIPTPTPE